MSTPVKDPGVGSFSKKKAKRFINPDGTFNVTHFNRKRTINEAYTYLIGISWLHFFCLLLLGFFLINFIFAGVYVLTGVAAISIKHTSFVEDFLNAFFFSVQTMTSLGYGYFSPIGIIAGVISSIEALLGLVIFAFMTGLLYGRFSKPRSNIRFSDSLVLCKKDGVDTIMFRLMNRRKSLLVLPKIEVSVSISTRNKDLEYKNDFFQLQLERKKITYLPTTWTIVHHIDDSSPLYKYTRKQIKELHGELLILISYYDESFNQELHQAHSYTFEDIKMGYRFKKAFNFNEHGKVVLDHSLIDAMEPES